MLGGQHHEGFARAEAAESGHRVGDRDDDRIGGEPVVTERIVWAFRGIDGHGAGLAREAALHVIRLPRILFFVLRDAERVFARVALRGLVEDAG